MKIEKFKDKALGYLAIFLIIVLFSSLTRSLGRAKLVKSEIDKKKQEIARIEAENEELKTKLVKSQSAEFVEREIRNKLGFVKSNEVVVFLPEPDVLKSLSPAVPKGDESTPDPNWKRWLKLFM